MDQAARGRARRLSWCAWAMSKMRTVLIGTLALFSATLSCADDLPILPAPDEIATLARPEAFKNSPLRSLNIAATPSGSAQPQSVPTRSPRGKEPVAVIAIDPELLRAPAMMGPNNELLWLGQRRPAAGPLTIQMGGSEFQLAWVAETAEPSSSVRHETMQVLEVPGGYARFSVNAEQVVGTIVTPQATYRIVPHGPRTQAVFMASAAEPSYSHFKYARLLNASSAGAALEHRHLQLERLSEIQPEYAAGSEAGRYLAIRGGNLGRIDGKVDVGKTRAVIDSLGELANAPEDLQVKIEKIYSHEQGTQITFHQLVGGIPHFVLNEINTDKSGNIVSVRTQFVDAGKADAVSLSEPQAQRLAVAAIEDRIKAPLEKIELLKPTELFYYHDASTARVAPRYTFYIRAKGPDATWGVQVDAANGSTHIVVNPQ
jgi:hypothetical protein